MTAPSDFNVKQPAKPKEVRKRFSDVAKQQSDCESYSKAGELGEVYPGGLLPPVEAAARSLSVGDVSEVVECEDGYALLYRTR